MGWLTRAVGCRVEHVRWATAEQEEDTGALLTGILNIVIFNSHVYVCVRVCELQSTWYFYGLTVPRRKLIVLETQAHVCSANGGVQSKILERLDQIPERTSVFNSRERNSEGRPKGRTQRHLEPRSPASQLREVLESTWPFLLQRRPREGRFLCSRP